MNTASTEAPAELGPYSSVPARSHALKLGMFVFLVSETLLFAGLFALYAGYRAEYPAVFAQGTRFNEEWIGGVNTCILLLSSFFVAWAELSAKQRAFKAARLCMIAAWLLGAAFLALKALEYVHHWHKGIRPGVAYFFPTLQAPGASLFFSLYYLLTGLHALHMLAGLTALTCMIVAVSRRTVSPLTAVHVELTALYWHLVDMIWVFLWPILYLTH